MQAIAFRPATQADALFIGANLRAIDIREAQLVSSLAPADLVEASRTSSVWSRVADVDEHPAMIFGVSPSNEPGWGVPWLAATDKFGDINKRLVRSCHLQIEEMQTLFPCLHNIIHRDNHTSINWLRWLGFTVDPTPLGPGNEFLLFWRK